VGDEEEYDVDSVDGFDPDYIFDVYGSCNCLEGNMLGGADLEVEEADFCPYELEASGGDRGVNFDDHGDFSRSTSLGGRALLMRVEHPQDPSHNSVGGVASSPRMEKIGEVYFSTSKIPVTPADC
jgi:hypothetical protein